MFSTPENLIVGNSGALGKIGCHFLSKNAVGYLQNVSARSYKYQKMPMELNISPSIWQSYINTILVSLQNRKCCEAIMDDLLLLTPSKRVHMAKLEDLLKALLKNGLKIPPKKCQLFKTEVQYMGMLYS